MDSRAAREIALRTALSGTVSSLVSTAAISLLSRKEAGAAAAGTNATSHWIWGDGAQRVKRTDAKHTLLGYAIHHASAMLWASVFETWQRSRGGSLGFALGRAAAVAAGAAFVDYKLTPKRLTPGFEAHLSRRSMALVYATFALGIALPALARIARSPASRRRR